MKLNKFFLLMAAVAWVAAPLRAERRGDQGIGLMLGNPSGATWKMWLDENVGVDLAAGVDRSEFDVHATLLYHNFNLTKGTSLAVLDRLNQNGDLPVYFGVGPRALFEHKTEFGVRFPIGISYLPNETPWEIFVEVAPVLRLTPDTGFNGDYAIGARYYFPAIRPKAGE